MSSTFIPGWQTTISLNAEDLTVVGNVLSFVRTKSSQPKPVFGSPFRNEIPGQASGALEAEGHVAVEKVQALEDLFNAQASVAYSIAAGQAGAATEAGTWTGKLVVTNYELTSDAEGEWEWSISATLDGAPLYTPPTP
jgi:hypothetical protein